MVCECASAPTELRRHSSVTDYFNARHACHACHSTQTEHKLHLFRTIFEKGRASMTKEDWNQEAKATGKNPRGLRDQLKRGLKPRIEEVSGVLGRYAIALAYISRTRIRSASSLVRSNHTTPRRTWSPFHVVQLPLLEPLHDLIVCCHFTFVRLAVVRRLFGIATAAATVLPFLFLLRSFACFCYRLCV